MTEPTAPSNPLAALAKQSQDTAKMYQEAADKLRARATSWGSAVQALGLAAVAWIGFEKLVDVFPTHGLGWLFGLLVLAGILLMASSAIFIGKNLTTQNRSLAVSLNIDEMCSREEITPKESDRIRGIYRQFAVLNATSIGTNVEDEPTTLTKESREKANQGVGDALAEYFEIASAYEAAVELAYRHDKNTKTISSPTSAAVITNLNLGLSRASQIRADLLVIQARACVVVIRDRINAATIGAKPIAAISVFAGALIAVWFLSDAAHSINQGRTEQIAYAKSCGEAKKALADGGAIAPLPGNCDAATGSDAGDRTTRDIAVANLVALSADFATCTASAKSKDTMTTNKNRESCTPIMEAITRQLELIK